MKLLITIAYDGRGYCGWQAQPNGMSVQQRVNEAAAALFGFDCDITGCSRTDSGVHARAFCATVTQCGTDSLATSVPIDRIPRAIDNFLPPDISVLSAKWVDGDFHARYDVTEKEYEYLIFDRPERDPFLNGRVWQYPRRINDDGLAAMNIAATNFVGKHDFTSFMAQGSSVTDATRTVTSASVTRNGDVISFRVSADGFLYNMVRIMTGTLTDVAEGRVSPGDISAIMAARNRSAAGMTAPACGLYLNKVTYNK